MVRPTLGFLTLFAALAFPALCFGGYEITDLGAFGSAADTSQGVGINQAGVVVGTATSGATTFAFKSDPGSGPLHGLGDLPVGSTSRGAAINSLGVVVGDGTDAQGRYHAITVNVQGQRQDIGLLSGWTGSHATAINDLGQVVGYSDMAGGGSHGFAYTTQTGLVDLGAFGGQSSQVYGINASGTLVGTVEMASGATFAFRKTAASPVQVFDGLNGAGTISVGLAINNAGEVVGYGGPSSGYHAFRSLAGGALQDLGTLPGAINSYAYAVNDSGTIVGAATTSAGSSRAILYSDPTGMVDLNSVLVNGRGWQLGSASGINDYGQITGTGLLNGVTHAFLLTASLTPVPEPPAHVLAGLGVLALAAFCHTRRGCGHAAERS